MKRDLKFRVWDKTRQKFHEGFCNILMSLDGKLFWNFGYNHMELLDEDEFIVSQFTGLRDKSEKDIYEGDIIKHNL